MNNEMFLARPSKAQYEWQDMEMGMFFHWFPSIKGKWDDSRIETFEHQKELAETMDCPEFDPAQWVQSAVDLGAKYIVFVAKHGRGICRWRSKYGGLNFKYSPYKNGNGDPLGELAEECRKRGIRLGVYLQGISETYHTGQGGKTAVPEKQDAYNSIYRGWLTEILSKYGEMVEVWFDGSIMIEVGDIIKKYAPNAIVFQSKYANIRWVGQEDGFASYPAWNSLSRIDGATGIATHAQGNPDGDVWMPLECDARLRRDWGYNDDPGNSLNSLDRLMGMYYRSVGHGANLLINHAPHPSGKIIDEDLKRMKEFGDEIRRRFGHPIAETSGEGMVVELDLKGKHKVDHVITMEEIGYGERIRAYCIEGFDGEKWVRLTGGISVGHKKIDYFNETELEKIRIKVLKNIGTPIIRSITAHYAGVTPEIMEEVHYGEVKVGELGIEQYDINTGIAKYTYEIDPYIKDAGQYRISFRCQKNYQKLEIENAWIEIDGIRYDEYVKRADGENEFDIFIGGLSDNIVFCAETTKGGRYIIGETYFFRVS
ncbi:MAG: alpha-L-fucosidase [Firmicutes bacterium]|nr:alpha-L-fucosidase [Bacillota bacterium]